MGRAWACLDISSLPASSVHALPHKWLVDAEALGLTVASPQDPPVPVESVFYLSTEGAAGSSSAVPSQSDERHLEIALVEADRMVLGELASIPGITRLEAVHASLFPLF